MENKTANRSNSARNCALGCAALFSAALATRFSMLDGVYVMSALATLIVAGPLLWTKVLDLVERCEVTAQEIGECMGPLLTGFIMTAVAIPSTAKALDQGGWSISTIFGLLLCSATSVAVPVCVIKHCASAKHGKVSRFSFVFAAAPVIYSMLALVMFTDSFAKGMQ